ncbi:MULTISPECIES: ferritin-like domain-containing protein [unclassified Mesorhizobium]|uniref:ferritin-like domain-containing protein n=1 Tax=unclassified Mesorhizobium TaxID=325217 RepID=UPI0003CE599E|nr:MULTISPECIES: ferritin-like domain-containing protein [unclassified Mesorhizobium]ESY55556.1 hypothetical protein X745_11865 [Mesorhizobium sp. LNJC374B00]ESY57255.1 hypothetical protein X744_19335 [Mesorhizobium sp. LNJC372A00]WJI79396.1 ferritin-like protein [Mesorhizobium sp. C374B]WJI85931.1 ferritin-like protein [Mesorhizobium sp. C372A]
MSPVLATSAIGRAVIAYDLPKVPGAQNALQEAGALLDMAAEIEHSLMVQYLYAGFAAVQSAAGQQPNKLLRDIAVEEMGHLLTVTNIRLLLGLEPYLRRQDESPQEGFDPYPFALEPLSAASLAKYVAAESPSENVELEPGDKKAFDDVLTRLKQKSGTLIHRVGLVYMRLFYLFQEDDNSDQEWREASIAAAWGEKWHIADADLVGGDARQSDYIEWEEEENFLGLKVVGKKSVREAIAKVAGQGEGGEQPAVGEPSHFLRFLRLFAAVESEVLSRPVPTMGADDITAEPAVTLTRLFDLRYEMLLVVLQRFFLASGATRKVLRVWCEDEMRLVLAGLYRLIVKHPREAGMDPAAAPAAPYFNMPSSPVPIDDASLLQRYATAKHLSAAMIDLAVSMGVDKSDQAFKRIAAQDAAL